MDSMDTLQPTLPYSSESLRCTCQLAKVLFVCTGNICRSPTAEAVFLAKAAAGIEVVRQRRTSDEERGTRPTGVPSRSRPPAAPSCRVAARARSDARTSPPST